jgi:hypothetical protein
VVNVHYTSGDGSAEREGELLVVEIVLDVTLLRPEYCQWSSVRETLMLIVSLTTSPPRDFFSSSPVWW